MHLLGSAFTIARTHSILLMVAVFAGIVTSTYWPGRRPEMERYGAIPFRDDR